MGDDGRGARLSAQDQARVDRVLRSGVNSVERGPPRLWRVLLVCYLVVAGLGLVSWLLGRHYGVL